MSLEVLHISECGEIAPRVFDLLPHLVELAISGEDFTIDSEIWHPRLRFLFLNDEGEQVYVRLFCPSLETLRMSSVDLDANCLTNLNDTCPMLKRLEVKWVKDEEVEDVTSHALDIAHETLEVLELENCWSLPSHMYFQHKTLLRLVCPNLRRLVLLMYTDVPHLPSILRTLPTLETLEVTLAGMHWPTMKLEHGQLQSLTIGGGKIDKLVIIMPKLDNLLTVSCMVESIQVASREIVNVDFSHCEYGRERSHKANEEVEGLPLDGFGSVTPSAPSGLECGVETREVTSTSHSESHPQVIICHAVAGCNVYRT